MSPASYRTAPPRVGEQNLTGPVAADSNRGGSLVPWVSRLAETWVEERAKRASRNLAPQPPEGSRQARPPWSLDRLDHRRVSTGSTAVGRRVTPRGLLGGLA